MSDTNTNQQKKDRREWTVMNLFIQNYISFPIGNVEKSECPDFIVSTKNKNGKTKRIGIELTELKYERNDTKFNMRAHEDFLTRIMDDAESFFRARHNAILNVDVHFSDNISPLILRENADDQAAILRQALSETVARIVEDNLPECTGKKYKVDRSYKYGDINLPQHIDSMTITNVSGRQDEPLWYASMSTHVKPLSIESISQRIKDKDEKLKHYENDLDEQWLLIIQNSFLMSKAYNPAEALRALQHKYRTNFNKIFVFERSEAKVNQLNIIRKIR